MGERKNVQIIYYEHGWGAGTPEEFHKWIDELADRVPEEFRSSSEISVLEEYDDDLPEYRPGAFKISWERPETDIEMQNRINNERSHAEWLEETERREYERLKAKFGGG